MTRLPSAWRASGAPAVNGKYQATSKKAVSDFAKEQTEPKEILDR
jgi:hypothetical protein